MNQGCASDSGNSDPLFADAMPLPRLLAKHRHIAHWPRR